MSIFPPPRCSLSCASRHMPPCSISHYAYADDLIAADIAGAPYSFHYAFLSSCLRRLPLLSPLMFAPSRYFHAATCRFSMSSLMLILITLATPLRRRFAEMILIAVITLSLRCRSFRLYHVAAAGRLMMLCAMPCCFISSSFRYFLS